MLRRVAKRALRPIIDRVELARLPRVAKHAMRADAAGPPDIDPGAAVAIAAALDWLKRAQDCSASADGGVARHFSLLTGWGASYPETTGYIVPTLLDHAERSRDADLFDRARRMLDWLVSLQFPDGGFPGGVVGDGAPVPVTFNTGQILLGLADGVRVFGDAYRPAMRLTADWLAETLDDDGCWRRYRSPFTAQDDKTYETHVSWGLFEASRIEANQRWAEAGMRQVRWALTEQSANGWLDQCCLEDATNPLTHTLGYALRGIIECHRYSRGEEFLAAARRLADGLISAQSADGRLPGRLRRDWSAGSSWICLTGLVQIAHCWLLLYRETGEPRYREAGFAGNAFVRRTVAYDAPPDIRGGVKGSFPVHEDYGRFEYLNWAAKFFIDSNQIETDIRAVGLGPNTPDGVELTRATVD